MGILLDFLFFFACGFISGYLYCDISWMTKIERLIQKRSYES